MTIVGTSQTAFPVTERFGGLRCREKLRHENGSRRSSVRHFRLTIESITNSRESMHVGHIAFMEKTL